MAMQLDPERQKLIEQVLEYWYTVDFLAQGGLNTEETRRERENWSFAMNHPTRFSIIYRHVDLNPGEDILCQVSSVEDLIRSKRDELEPVGGYGRVIKPPCHGKVTVYLGAIDQSYLSLAIANELQCEPPLNPSSAKLALASMQLNEDGEYIKGTLSLSPIAWALGRIMGRKAGDSMYDTLDPAAYKSSAVELEPEKDEKVLKLFHKREAYSDKVVV